MRLAFLVLLNISATLGWIAIAMESGSDISGTQRMNPNDFSPHATMTVGEYVLTQYLKN